MDLTVGPPSPASETGCGNRTHLNTVAKSLLSSTYLLSGLRYSQDQIERLYMSLSTILEDSTTFQHTILIGRVRGYRDLLLRQGRSTFGDPSPAAESAIRGIEDVGRLERLADRLLTATNWDDLLASP